MKFQSSTLFVNTGRKPLPGMQKKKKTSKNNIALGVCIAIIAVLCVFVGLIVHVWINYNEDVAPKEKPVAGQVSQEVDNKEPVKPEKTKKPKKEAPAKPEKEEPVPEEEPVVQEEPEAEDTGSETDISKLAAKQFKNIDGEYSFGIMNLSDGTTYIGKNKKVNNSAALAPFLAEYASNAIYLGTFDYTTDVSGYAGRDLMTMAFSQGSTDAANMLISHFGVDSLNSYFASKGYENTHFGGVIGSEESYTTSEDLVKLMNKFYNNTTFFPYSDMYKKMQNNTVDDKIMSALTEGSYGANISFTSGNETVDAAVIYTPNGNYIFVAMAETDDIAAANKAMANTAKGICKAGQQ